MSQVDLRTLVRSLRRAHVLPFQRPGRMQEVHHLEFGFGKLFWTCWNGQKRMIHSSGTACCNCGQAAADRSGSSFPPADDKLRSDSATPVSGTYGAKIGSVNICTFKREGPYYGLFLPHLPTAVLLQESGGDDKHNVLQLTTQRPGGDLKKIRVETNWLPRNELLTESRREEGQTMIRAFILHHFGGDLSDQEAWAQCVSFQEAGAVL